MCERERERACMYRTRHRWGDYCANTTTRYQFFCCVCARVVCSVCVCVCARARARVCTFLVYMQHKGTDFGFFFSQGDNDRDGWQVGGQVQGEGGGVCGGEGERDTRETAALRTTFSARELSLDAQLLEW